MSAHVAQSAERRLGKAEVVGSIPIVSSSTKKNTKRQAKFIKEFIGYNIEEQFFELFTIKGGFNNGKGKI